MSVAQRPSAVPPSSASLPRLGFVDRARAADRFLAVDMSYERAHAFRSALEALSTGELGEVYAAELVFHNAYAPDKGWSLDPDLAGGGCVMDLAPHLVGLALAAMPGAEIGSVESRLFAQGEPVSTPGRTLEDHTEALLTTTDGRAVRIACSWRHNAGKDADIRATFHTPRAAVSVRNTRGAFFDFRCAVLRGSTREVIASPHDDWGGRAAAAWAHRLATDNSFDPRAERAVEIAHVIDRIYER